MMAGNPSWWSMLMHPPNNSLHHHHLQPYSSLLSSSPSPSPSFPFSSNLLSDPQEHPQSSSSWSQLILSGSQGEDDRPFTDFQPKRFENWEEHQQHQMMINPYYSSSRVDAPDVKQELVPQTNNLYVHGAVVGDQFQAAWPQIIPLMPVSPRSCVTTLSSATTNVLDFSHTKAAATHNNKIIGHQHQDHSSECNSKATGGGGGGGGVSKKARVQTSSSQPPLKVMKEKLGDRITALHQLVSPFGKTDTASVLLEAIGYIRFLQGQIEALSSPYLSTSSSSSAANMMRNQHCVQVDMNGAFPEDPGQLLNDTCLKRKGAPNQDEEGKSKDLKSRGLCLVPVSCTDQQVGNNVNGADYWAPAPGGGGF